MQLGDATTWPFATLMPWAGSRSVWHAWGDQMAGALAAAADLTEREHWAQQAGEVAGTFTPHLLAQGGPDHSWMPTPAERSQIADGVDADAPEPRQHRRGLGRRRLPGPGLLRWCLVLRQQPREHLDVRPGYGTDLRRRDVR